MGLLPDEGTLGRMRPTANGATLPDMQRLLSMLLVGTAPRVALTSAAAVKPDPRYGFSAREFVGPDACGFPFVFVVRGKGQTLLFADRDGDIVRGRATGPIKITFDEPATARLSRTDLGPSFTTPMASRCEDRTLVRVHGRRRVYDRDRQTRVRRRGASRGNPRR